MANNTLILEISHMIFPVSTRIVRSNVSDNVIVTIKLGTAIVVDKVYKPDQEEYAKKEGNQLHDYWCGIADEIFSLGYNTATKDLI